MKIKINKDWLDRRASKDDKLEVAAGAFPCELAPQSPELSPDRERIVPAFGRLINLCRRRNGMTMEQLASVAKVDVDEIFMLEHDPAFLPEPRTVYQLAVTLGLPENTMMELSGNVVAHDEQLSEQAVRFAARSEPLEKLTAEEQQALNEFVAYLSGK